MVSMKTNAEDTSLNSAKSLVFVFRGIKRFDLISLLELWLIFVIQTGRCKHYGFIEFDSSSVAQIVADTMDNYLLSGHILKCKLIPKEEVHSELWIGANRKWKVISRDKTVRMQQNKVSLVNPKCRLLKSAPLFTAADNWGESQGYPQADKATKWEEEKTGGFRHWLRLWCGQLCELPLYCIDSSWLMKLQFFVVVRKSQKHRRKCSVFHLSFDALCTLDKSAWSWFIIASREEISCQETNMQWGVRFFHTLGVRKAVFYSGGRSYSLCDMLGALKPWHNHIQHVVLQVPSHIWGNLLPQFATYSTWLSHE